MLHITAKANEAFIAYPQKLSSKISISVYNPFLFTSDSRHGNFAQQFLFSFRMCSTRCQVRTLRDF